MQEEKEMKNRPRPGNNGYKYTDILQWGYEDENENIFQLWRKCSSASKKRGAISGLGVLIAHLTPGTPTAAVSSIKNGIPLGILAERYNTSWFAFFLFAMKNMFEAANLSRVDSMLLITSPGNSLNTSFESGRDFHVCRVNKDSN